MAGNVNLQTKLRLGVTWSVNAIDQEAGGTADKRLYLEFHGRVI